MSFIRSSWSLCSLVFLLSAFTNLLSWLQSLERCSPADLVFKHNWFHSAVTLIVIIIFKVCFCSLLWTVNLWQSYVALAAVQIFGSLCNCVLRLLLCESTWFLMHIVRSIRATCCTDQMTDSPIPTCNLNMDVRKDNGQSCLSFLLALCVFVSVFCALSQIGQVVVSVGTKPSHSEEKKQLNSSDHVSPTTASFLPVWQRK